MPQTAPKSANFGFLLVHDPLLDHLGALAERYFSDDPSTCLIKLRQFGETLAQRTAAHAGLYASTEENQAELLRRLRDRGLLPREIGDLFHGLRKAGNAATHDLRGDHREALYQLRMAWKLGAWFHGTFPPRRRRMGARQPGAGLHPASRRRSDPGRAPFGPQQRHSARRGPPARRSAHLARAGQRPADPRPGQGIGLVTIPDYQSLMLPLLQALADGREHLVGDVRESLAAQFRLGAAEREALLPSGKQPIFDNRLGWAKTYLAKSGLVASVRRGVYQLTERGRAVLSSKPARVDSAFLAQFPEFQEFQRKADDASLDGAGTPSRRSSGTSRSRPARPRPRSPWTPPTTSCAARPRRSCWRRSVALPFDSSSVWSWSSW